MSSSGWRGLVGRITDLVPLAMLLPSCAPIIRPLTEDQSRVVAPMPVCLSALEARRETSTLRRLRDPEVTRLVLPKPGLACNGAPVSELVDPAGSTASHDDIVYGSGADRLKAAWLPVASYANGEVGGILAVVRPSERFAEAYGIGGYRGHRERARFGVRHVGESFLVTAEEDGCQDRKGTEGCVSVTTVFLPTLGRLRRAAEVTTERYARFPATERGSAGMLDYHLQASLQYTTNSIVLTEVIEVTDDKGRAVRRLEGERSLAMTADGFAGPPPLWDKIAPVAGRGRISP